MSGKLEVKNEGAIVDGIARDGEPFQHLNENHRDTHLNGATQVDVGIEEQGLLRTIPVGRRMIRDAGPRAGMSARQVTDVYCNFGISGTLLTSPYLPTVWDETLHKRKGIGGRATTLLWNGYGYVTVTVKDGVASMVWFYRDQNGDYRIRSLPDNETPGSYANVVAPYVEPEFIDQDWLDEDPEFAAVFMPYLTKNRRGQYLNPEFGIDWAVVLQQDGFLKTRNINGPIADDILVDQATGEMKVTLDGAPSNGTVKIMLGESPNHHTALTGDPWFKVEAKAEEYDAYLQHKLWDMPLSTEVYVMFPSSSTKHTLVTLPIDGVDTTFRFSRREIKGSKVHHLGAYDPVTNEYENVEPGHHGFREVDAYGTKAYYYVLKESALNRGGNTWKVEERRGFIAVRYLNELYEVSSHHEIFKGFGIAKPEVRERTIIVIEPPLAVSGALGGVYNNTARSDLKWLGATSNRLPWEDWKVSFRRKFPDEIKVLQQGSATTPTIHSTKVRDRLVQVFNKVARGYKSKNPVPQPSASGSNGNGTKGAKQPALLEGRDTIPMSKVGKQGVPGDGTQDNTKKRPNNRPGGGSKGRRFKGLPDPKGDVLGGASKATTGMGTGHGQMDLDPPTFYWDPTYFNAVTDAALLFKWQPDPNDDKCKTSAGIIHGNYSRDLRQGHLYFAEQVAEFEVDNAHRDADGVRDAVLGLYEEKVSQQVMIALALRDHVVAEAESDTGAKVRVKWTAQWARSLLKDEALTLAALDVGINEFAIKQAINAVPLSVGAAPAATAVPVP